MCGRRHEIATQATNVVDYNKQGKCSGCTTGLGECGSPIARPVSVLYYLEMSTFWFVLVSLIKRLIETRKHAIFVDSETCPSCFHDQELNEMSNSPVSLIQFNR